MALIGQLQHVALMLALSPWLAFLVKLYVVVGELNDVHSEGLPNAMRRRVLSGSPLLTSKNFRASKIACSGSISSDVTNMDDANLKMS